MLNMWWEPAILGTKGVRLPGPTDGLPGRLKLELAKSKADECLLSEEVVRPSLGLTLPRGVEVMEGASNSITSLREPIGLRKVSNMLESGVDCTGVHPMKIPSFVSC